MSQRNEREDARATVSHEQMRSTPRYPVDRYMVESSNKIEMVNIIDDELWNTEPALRPEDEIVLRKLHDMLQSTADDLKLLSSDLAKYHQPGVQIKTQPMPLDEDFNEKIHIEELVNAKFHGHKIIDKPASTYKIEKLPNSVNTGVQVDVLRKTDVKKLEVTRTRLLEINEKKKSQSETSNTNVMNPKRAPTVAYNEFVYKQEESKADQSTQNKFKIQDMPSINIRNELKPQKVLQLDIFPDNKATGDIKENNTNVAVVAIEHNIEVAKTNPKITLTNKQVQPATTSHETANKSQLQSFIKNQPIRKVSKMSTLESSESGNNVSSDTMHSIKAQKHIKSIIRSSALPKHNFRDKIKNKKVNMNKEPDKKTRSSINEWRTKLNDVYGQSLLSKTKKVSAKQLKTSSLAKKTTPSESSKQHKTSLNKAEYIPYAQLTLGGVRVSDIEKEISDISNKGDIPLSPVLDKILSSRENSVHKQRFIGNNNKDSPRILTTSDENLLQEVIDIERKVSKTIKKSMSLGIDKVEEEFKVTSDSKEDDEKNSYADDFEEENTGNTNNSNSSSRLDITQDDPKIHSTDSDIDTNKKNIHIEPDAAELARKPHNITYTKQSNLSLKNSVDVFEIVHSINTQDIATQSNVTHKISLKETQTSPRNEKPNIQPIHNDLWPVDPKGEVEKMFKMEKDFIKKLIIDEYGEFFEKSFTKPSTSKAAPEQKQMNIAATQKITQTSPARVKSVMTSPTMTKTRTTSPFLSVKVDHQTSPLIVVTNEEQLTVELGDDEDGISINLSSPRFSLRLPQTSREVLSNLEGASLSPLQPKAVDKDKMPKPKEKKAYRKSTISSSSSDVENSTEMSSLGEVKWKLKRRLRKKVSSISESSESSSSLSKYSSEHLTGSILPLRSEGEVSLGQLLKKVKNKPVTSSKSEGEASFRRTK